MKRFWILCIVTCVMAVGIASCNFNASTSGAGDIVIASKDFTEQDILGELLAQQIEETTDLTVTRRPRLGGSFVCHNAIIAGQIDAYIEYTGTAFTAILKQQAVNDPKVVHEQLKQAYAKQFNLEVMPSLGFENTFAMIIRGEDARRYNIQTLSEAAKYTPQWRGGFGYEFLEREDGFPGLAKTYGLRFAISPQIMDLGLIYRALIQKQVDMVAGNSTDGQISRLGLVVLKDNQQYFPPYEAAPIVRKETLNKYPQLRTAINQLSGKITSDEMRELNNLVEGELQDIKTVVREFRKSQGL
ncbi:glycine betaine ABC transporter substrate-binding protein [Nodularia spumigena CS-584]|jgi:osmoprotectant transport system substrate-binding protein|uniref:glycine betaine ABC transporter substrate-binding protein n=1 Tax=Nodularia spumigena TaxID=70799 RepID=UPI0002DFCEA7|nr:glycine betaine ABC transporter substrate-binding protein [Nodularia spumigena]AHJ30615.1 Substrate-binding region of ABC-type glycine betaine transport system [Nodularia spumigena CCY9414]MDB9384746.1 glycine betaine ABC transporter substrate-binding protein [Nodularia spumigena CS-584]MEA5558529.1 glycine betaine ABC transporter substrate-binding protein [Nodularia spumigena CH309]MEA5615197.1 glycine betaine ABC transporter substrate-binding protein [Nodularia spumigena UHCC 0040]